MDPVIIAAWITAGGVIVAAIIVPLIKVLASLNPDIFPEREVSDETWFRDMKNAERLIFLGTSHVKLDTYLYQYLQSVQDGPLRSIEIYYASNESGFAREKAKFSVNMRNSRHDIAARVCGPEWMAKFRHFESVHFRQAENAAAFSGSVIYYKSKAPVVYVVQHPFKGSFEADDLITFRYAPTVPAWLGNKKQKAHKKYLSAYGKLKNNSESIGEFAPSLWDRSVKEWSRFSIECNAHRESMKALASLAQLQTGDKVLDLASGSGHISSIILEKCPEISLTLLDASPGMIKSASELLGDRAEYALCRLPDSIRGCNVDAPATFDAIFVHLALPSVASDKNQLTCLAEWCLKHLSSSGRILLCAHNTALDETSGFSIDNDILRSEFTSELESMKRSDCFRMLRVHPINPDAIASSFARTGLELVDSFKKSFHMTMKDRIIMWSAPVVLNNIVDVEKFGYESISDLVRRVARKIEHRETPEMTVTYWLFKKVEIAGQNATKA